MRLSLKILLLMSLSSGVYAESRGLLVDAFLAPYQLKLLNNKNNCQLTISQKEKKAVILQLESKSPCYFFADSSHQTAQLYSYKEDGIDNVLLIGGTAVEQKPDETQAQKKSSQDYCSQDIQAIILEHGEIKLGERNTESTACSQDRLDEKIYQQAGKQTRSSLEQLLQAQKKSKQVIVESSFFTNLQQKIQAIFSSDKAKE